MSDVVLMIRPGFWGLRRKTTKVQWYSHHLVVTLDAGLAERAPFRFLCCELLFTRRSTTVLLLTKRFHLNNVASPPEDSRGKQELREKPEGKTKLEIIRFGI